MRNLALILALFFFSGCTVYKSSDRDDFDANGKARAVASQKPALTLEDRDLLANPCSAFNAVSDDQLKQLFGPNPRLSMVNEVSPKTATCVVRSTSMDLSAPSVLSCSWKPVDGQPVAILGEDAENISQTTEDDLRGSGFDVVATTVARGTTLRMNCEAYVPTTGLIDDHRMGDHASNPLRQNFSVFTHELVRETLPVSTQH